MFSKLYKTQNRSGGLFNCCGKPPLVFWHGLVAENKCQYFVKEKNRKMAKTQFQIFCERYVNINYWGVFKVVNIATKPQNNTFANATIL